MWNFCGLFHGKVRIEMPKSHHEISCVWTMSSWLPEYWIWCGNKKGARWIFFHLCQNMKMSWIFCFNIFKICKKKAKPESICMYTKNDPTTGSLHFDCLYSCQSKLQDLFFKNFCFVYNSEKKPSKFDNSLVGFLQNSLNKHRTPKLTTS